MTPTFRPLLASAVALVLAACSQGASASVPVAGAQPVEKPGVAVVARHVVEAKPLPQSLSVTGNLLPGEDSEVAAGALGKVVSATVERGQRVKKGDLLAQLDARVAEAQAAAAKAQADVAKANLDAATLECARSKTLREGGSVTAAADERVQANCRAAAAQFQAADANARMAMANYADTSIRAPFDGVVGERYVSPGEYVRQDSKVVSLLATSTLRVELSIPESAASQVKVGQPLQFTTPGQTKHFEAKVAWVSPAVRRASRDLLVEALVQNGDASLSPGQFVTAQLQLAETPVPVVPKEAVKTVGGQPRLFVVHDGQLEERLVRLGSASGDQLSVLSGLQAGEEIAAEARPDLADGQAVR